MKFLCIHGMGTNSAILKAQLSSVLKALRSSRHEFVFVEGKLDCEPGKDIDTYFSGPYRCFYTGPNPKQIRAARAQVLDTVNRLGPFDGVIGFSQGAAFAASLIIEAARHDIYNELFSLAVFIGSPTPYELVRRGDGADDSAAEGTLTETGMETAEECQPDTSEITIPTVHVLGEKDDFFPLGKQLIEMCTGETRVITHDEGHVIPRTPGFTKQLVNAIEETIEEIEFMT